MSTVLRGGRWGDVLPEQTNSRPETNGLSDGPHQELSGHDDSAVLVCLVLDRKTVGVACYNEMINEISVTQIAIQRGMQDICRLKFLLQATLFILPSSARSNTDLINAILEGQSEQQNIGSSNSAPSSSRARSTTSNDTGEGTISYIGNTDVSVSKASEVLSLVSLLGMPSNLTASGRLGYMSHIWDESECILRAAGGLLSFLLKNNILNALDDHGDPICINAITRIALSDVMHMSPTTLRALQVFQLDTHPVGHGSMRAKEGLSLFGILKAGVKTAIGARLLHSWLLAPSTDVTVIMYRQSLVKALRTTANHSVYTALREALRGVKNVPSIIGRIRKVSATVNDWKGLYTSAKSFLRLFDAFRVAAQQDLDIASSPMFARISNIDEEDIRGPLHWIEAMVDFEESRQAGRLIVAHGFSEDIDEMRRCYSGLSDFLTNIGVQEMHQLMAFKADISLNSLQITYQPQIGYLVLLEARDFSGIGQQKLTTLGFDFMFRGDQGYFFKNQRCYELDKELGDIHGAIVDLEAKAARYLESKVLPAAATLYEVSQLVYELDCLQALATASNEYHWVPPEVSTDQDGLAITNGRHALLELNVPSFVSNSMHIHGGDVHMVTGPNFSGKSVFLKQGALIVILAQIGSCVPADEARLTIVTRIYTRIASYESVSLQQSSFAIDASQVAAMLIQENGQSLLLIDEFGKGTAEVDGMALMASAIRKLLQRDQRRAPMCLCATHFVELLCEPHLPMDNTRLATFSMEILSTGRTKASGHALGGTASVARPVANIAGACSSVEPDKYNSLPQDMQTPHHHSDTVVRTYRVLRGSICVESRALQCAIEAGVPRDILSRAATVHAAVSSEGLIPDAGQHAYSNKRTRICFATVQAFLRKNFSGRD